METVTSSGRVLIVVLAHNSLALTKKCVASALAQDYPDFGVCVIDNASVDSTPQWLASTRSIAGHSFSTVLFKDRQSVAYCWNYMIEWAFGPANAVKYAGVLVLNNDTQLRADTITHLMADPAPFVTAVSVRTEAELRYPDPPTSRRPHPDFSCFLIKPEAWKKVGKFDECFELAYCEDCSWHVRAHLADVECMCIDLPFVHYGSGALKDADPAERRMIERAADRNRARFEEMYGCRPGTKEYEAIFQ